MNDSWIDRLIVWATTRRVPWWLLAIGWLVLEVLVVSAVKWWDGSLAVGQVYERVADLPYAVFCAVGYGFLVSRARTAFAGYRPALDVGDAEATRLERSITSLTPKMAWIAATVSLLFFSVAGVNDTATRELMSTSLAATVVIAFFAYAVNGVFGGVFVTLLSRQLLMVVRLHRRATHIDLFDSTPAHSFARLTAAGGTLVVLVTVYGAVTDPNTFTNPVWLWFSFSALVFSAVVFLAPLRGMHQRLRAEKRRLLRESAARIRTTSALLHQALDDARYAGVADLRTALQALDEDRTRVKRASTLPWEPATLRGFASTIGVPIVVWLVTSLLGETLGF